MQNPESPNKCPKCPNGYYNPEFTTCGIVLAVCFFPIGILCCWLMREDKCNACGAVRAS